MEDFIRISIEQDIDRCVKIWGIEGMEDKIYSIYAGSSTLRARYLEIFYNKFPFLNKR
jgi:hypothetical protein